MTKLQKAKEVIAKYYGYAECGIFDTQNIADDTMETVYEDDGLQIDICFDYEYFEVFGLTPEEFEYLERFYDELAGWDCAFPQEYEVKQQ